MAAGPRAVAILADEGDRAFAHRLDRTLRAGSTPIVTETADADVAVLVASPASARNDDLSRRVVDFLDERSDDDLAIVVVGGSIGWPEPPPSGSALAPAVAHALSREPIWLDARDEASASRAIARLTATLLPPQPAMAQPAAIPPAYKAGSVDAAAGPAPPQARRSRIAVVLAAIIGVLIVGALGFVGLLASSEQSTPDTSPTSPPPATTNAPATTSPPATTSQPATSSQPETTSPPVSATTIPGTVPPSNDAGSDRTVAPIVVVLAGTVGAGALLWMVRSRRRRPERTTERPQPRALPPPEPPSPSTRQAEPVPRRSRSEQVPVAFVSHDHEDAPLVDALASALQPEVTTWVSRAAIEPGDSWVFEISDALEESDAFVAVLTPRSLESTWVRRELSAALLLHERNGRPRFYPFKAEPCRLPVLLETFQVVDATTGDVDRATARLKSSILSR